MLQQDEYVVYGRSGVCRVEGIEQIDGQKYYCLYSFHQNCHIKTPINGTKPVRKVISEEEANALIDLIPAIRAMPLNDCSTQELVEKYRAYLSSQNCRDLIELTMSIYSKKREAQNLKKKLNSTDEAFLKEGESLLFGEMSVALGIPYDEVKAYIRKRVSKQQEKLVAD